MIAGHWGNLARIDVIRHSAAVRRRPALTPPSPRAHLRGARRCERRPVDGRRALFRRHVVRHPRRLHRERNEVWAERQYAITDLQRTATFLIAPGNDVFRPTTPDESARSATARWRTRRHAQAVRGQPDRPGARRLRRPDGRRLRHARERSGRCWSRPPTRCSRAVAAGRIDDARMAMVAMDQRLFRADRRVQRVQPHLPRDPALTEFSALGRAMPARSRALPLHVRGAGVS
mgnify:CR=1 FL=1